MRTLVPVACAASMLISAACASGESADISDTVSSDSSADQPATTPPSVSTSTTDPKATAPAASTAPISTTPPTSVAPTTTAEPAAVNGDHEWSVCWSADPAAGSGISFADVAESANAVEPLAGMHGHAAAAGDVNGDGWIDVFVGTFADRDAEVYRVRGATGPAPDRILLGGPDGFIVDTTFPEDRGRTSGAVFADLDGDGDDDLVAARNQRGDGGIRGRPSVVYENTGDGWRERSTIAPNNGARSVAAVDVDRDGFLDLVIASDRFGDGSTIALRGDGAFGFEESTVAWGIPTDLTGLALATVDVDSDGWLDVVVNGDARVLLGGDGGFEVTEVPELEWATFGNEDDPAGVAVGDLDGDSRPDLVLGHHFNSTVDSGERVPVRILLNRSDSSGVSFEDITDESGSPALWTKSPHVAIVDVDNDGANDIVTSAAAATGEPVVLRQLPTGAGEVRFETIGQEGSGEYYVTGVSDDFDRDGRVDSLLLAWEPERPSILADNRSASADWLEVDPGSSDVGLVEVIDPATGTVLARAWTQSTTGYAAGASEIVHFGLGDAPSEVVIRLGGADAATSDPVPINAAVSAIGC